MKGGLQVQAVSKAYGSVKALQDVTLSFQPGEVHALLGENGAGKSTLVNILAGLTRQDSGSVILDEQPQVGARLGIGVVHQHFTLVPEFTVAENIALFRLPSLATLLNTVELSRPAVKKAKELGWQIDLNSRIAGLPVGMQQRVEILKCLSDDHKVLVFDEPTAPLGGEEVADLLDILRKLATQGRIVILVAHKLSEVLAVADRVSVLRRGRVVAAGMPVAEVTAQSLAEMMVGELPPSPELVKSSISHSRLEVSELTVTGDRGEKAIENLSFSSDGGRIFGIGGVDGNGQTELAEALVGIRKHGGTITLDGKRPEQVAYIPADRHSDGLALEMSVTENLLLGRLNSWPKHGDVGPWVEEVIERFDIKVADPDASVSELSGGNQQKLIVARTLDSRPLFVVALNPTRGLDVKAARFVHDQLKSAANRGAVVILISADVDELYAVADEIRYLSRGQFASGSGAAAIVGGAE